MDASELADKNRQLESNRLQIRYYRLVTLLIVILFAIAAGYAYKNNQQLKKTVNIIQQNQHSNLINLQNQLITQQTLTRNGFICIFTAPPTVATSGKTAITNYLDKCYPIPRAIK